MYMNQANPKAQSHAESHAESHTESHAESPLSHKHLSDESISYLSLNQVQPWLNKEIPCLNCGFGIAEPWQTDRQLAIKLSQNLKLDNPRASVQLFNQVHGNRYWKAISTKEQLYDARGNSCLQYDGAEGKLDVLLVIKTADCVPILLVDGQTGRYAVLHAGWRGIASGILIRILQNWQVSGGLKQVRLVLGPHICTSCFQVKTDCLQQFSSQWLSGAVLEKANHYWLNLTAVLITQALWCGLQTHQLGLVPHCTTCETDEQGKYQYASYRRIAPQPRQVNLSYIGV